MATILIVDDNKLACEALSMVLEASGYTVQQVHRVADALDSVRQSTPDLAIVDLSMPDGNGVDLIHSLHQFEPNLPIILYSGYFTPEDDAEKRANAMDGIVAVFKKPLRNADLLRTIAETLN
jgi:two-component system NtrC family response regulator